MDNLGPALTNPILEVIHKRRSIRKFKDIPLDMEILGELVLAGRDAPSAGNLQARKFIVITDPAKKKALADACFHQYWIATAPAVIVITAEPEKLARFYGVRGERLYSIQETAVAAQNIILAAESLGLASCFVAAFDEEEVRALLGIPSFARPQVVIPIGYPDETVPEPPKYFLWDIFYHQSYGAKIRDVEGYMGFHYGRNVEKIVKKTGELLQKSGEHLDKGIQKIHEGIKKLIKKKEEEKQEPKEEVNGDEL